VYDGKLSVAYFLKALLIMSQCSSIFLLKRMGTAVPVYFAAFV